MIKHIFLIAVLSTCLAGCGDSPEQKQAARAEVAAAKMRAAQETMHQKNEADLQDYKRRHGGK